MSEYHETEVLHSHERADGKVDLAVGVTAGGQHIVVHVVGAPDEVTGKHLAEQDVDRQLKCLDKGNPC